MGRTVILTEHTLDKPLTSSHSFHVHFNIPLLFCVLLLITNIQFLILYHLEIRLGVIDQWLTQYCLNELQRKCWDLIAMSSCQSWNCHCIHTLVLIVCSKVYFFNVHCTVEVCIPFDVRCLANLSLFVCANVLTFCCTRNLQRPSHSDSQPFPFCHTLYRLPCWSEDKVDNGKHDYVKHLHSSLCYSRPRSGDESWGLCRFVQTKNAWRGLF